MNRTDAAATYQSTVRAAYEATHLAFEKARQDSVLYKYVVPASTAPNVGFAIFYTPPVYRPSLLIIGQNPANFAGARRALTDPPNRGMLCGTPPTSNSYLEHDHEFAITLRHLFRQHMHLLEGAVGMNLWHFQQPAQTSELPVASLRTTCEDTSRTLINAMRPKAILCLSARARDVLRKSHPENCWYVEHVTGSRTRIRAAANMPAALAGIDAYLRR